MHQEQRSSEVKLGEKCKICRKEVQFQQNLILVGKGGGG